MEKAQQKLDFFDSLCLPHRGRLRGSHVPMRRSEPSNAVPSQSACSADSSPKGRAKGRSRICPPNYNLPQKGCHYGHKKALL